MMMAVKGAYLLTRYLNDEACLCITEIESYSQRGEE